MPPVSDTAHLERADGGPRALPGDLPALDRLIPQIYGELCSIAHRIRRGRKTETLQTTALVHEAYLKLLGERTAGWADRSHLLGVAATAMRRILVHSIEAKRCLKRGGGHRRVGLTEDVAETPAVGLELLAVDEALDRLAQFDARKARLVELRYFAGLTLAEAAEQLGVGEATAKRDWAAAKLWILREVEAGRARAEVAQPAPSDGR